MVQYRRSRVAGGTFFFTVNLQDRRRTLLVEHADALRTMHINPVKHGHVARAMDWPHSTLHRYVRNGLLPADWACTSPEGTFGE